MSPRVWAVLLVPLLGACRASRPGPWSADGTTVSGRLIVEGGGAPVQVVAARMRLREDGRFSARLDPLSRLLPFGFRLHGYEPLDMTLPAPSRRGRVDLGTLVLKPLAEGRKAALKGRVILAGGGSPRGARVVLRVETPSFVSEPRPAGECAPGIELSPGPGGEFTGAGFSPTDYQAVFRAPGHVDALRRVAFEAGKTKDLGAVRLEAKKPWKVRFSYLAAAKPPFEGRPREAALGEDLVWRIPGRHWDAAERKYSKGYGRTLELRQKDGKLGFWIFYGPYRLADLGLGELEGFRGLAADKVRWADPSGITLEKGHVYLMEHGAFGYWALFRAEALD